MDVYKPLYKHILMPLLAKRRGFKHLDLVPYLEESQYYPLERIREIQWGQLKKLLDFAYETFPFYREKYDKAGFHPDDIKSFEDFRSIPILKKKELYAHQSDFHPPRVKEYVTFLTSGSTGIPLRGYVSKGSKELKNACAVRSGHLAGHDMGGRTYLLYGNPELEMTGFRKFKSKFRRRYVDRIEVLDLLKLTEDSMLEFARKMRRWPPSLLWGHVHGLFILSKFYKEKNILDIRPNGMYSAGMVLNNSERKMVEEVFQCPLQNRYGTEELGLIANECKKQEGLHINTDIHYLEFLDKEGAPVAPGERGLVIITDLSNYAMPLIRYRLEDIAVASDKSCSCGRTQPLIERIEGRTADFLVTPEGELVSGISLTDHFAGQIPGVAQIQIVQERLDLLRLNIVKDGTFGEHSKKTIAELLEVFFGPKMKHEYEFMDALPMGRSGKLRFTICKVDHELF